ncbi:MAG: hypothetical protein ABSF59_06115 [Candidatus Sulfotelmatobacter sp.]|jgi:hypothetical protein
MMTTLSPEISRQQFPVAGGLTAAATCLAPGHLFAQTPNLAKAR